MVWDPARIEPKPWEKVIEFYRHVAERNDDFRPMRRLVEHAASQPYAPSLFAATSGTALLVARDALGDWRREALRIDVALAGSIRFAHHEKRHVKPATFECEGTRIVEEFERFLRSAAWIA
jgi:hypothetical protein